MASFAEERVQRRAYYQAEYSQNRPLRFVTAKRPIFKWMDESPKRASVTIALAAVVFEIVCGTIIKLHTMEVKRAEIYQTFEQEDRELHNAATWLEKSVTSTDPIEKTRNLNRILSDREGSTSTATTILIRHLSSNNELERESAFELASAAVSVDLNRMEFRSRSATLRGTKDGRTLLAALKTTAKQETAPSLKVEMTRSVERLESLQNDKLSS